MFKCLLIGQWHGLSDSKLEESLRVRFDALPFAALDLHCTVRGETTHYRFRSDTAWSYRAYVPVSQHIYAAFRFDTKRLLPPPDEWRWREL